MKWDVILGEGTDASDLHAWTEEMMRRQGKKGNGHRHTHTHTDTHALLMIRR